MKEFLMKEFPLLSASAAFLLNDFWIHWLPLGWQFVIGGLGGVVLALTAYNKWLDAKLKMKDLNTTPEKDES